MLRRLRIEATIETAVRLRRGRVASDEECAMKMLEMRGVTKTYGEGANEVHALQGIDLSVEAGELVAVMGPSGSGKSTLLTIAGSLEEPTSGDVLVILVVMPLVAALGGWAFAGREPLYVSRQPLE